MAEKTIQENVNGLDGLENSRSETDCICKLEHKSDPEPASKQASTQASAEMSKFIITESGMFRKNPDDQPITKLTMNDFTEGDFINKGSFGVVCKARPKGEKFDVALKKCKIKPPDRLILEEKVKPLSQEAWYRELLFHINNIRHDHITWLHCFIVEKVPEGPGGALMKTKKGPVLARPRNLYLYLELMNCSFNEILNCPAFELAEHKKISPFKKEDVIDNKPFLAFLKHTSSGLAYLHGMDLMHRDIKPGNVLLKLLPDSKHALVKLTDFGTVKDYKDTTHEEHTLHSQDPGTTKYSAPEVICNEERYSMSCDLWPLGITSIQLITGYHPVLPLDATKGTSASTDKIYCRSISNNDDIFTDLPEKVGLEGDLAKILGRCMDRDAKNRPKASQVFDVASESFKDESDRMVLFDWFTSLDIVGQIEEIRQRR